MSDSLGRLGRIQSLARAAFSDLADQRRPFGRLALLHVVMVAGDTLVTISLAGSLFFSITPHAARGKVILYLLLTMAPFAVVAPALGPIIDRGRNARRLTVIASAFGRLVLCVLMARDISSVWLFPEAFGLLVLSKVYMVTRSALTPALADAGADLASANARLAFLASCAGFAAGVPAAAILKLGSASAVLVVDAAVFVAAAVLGMRLPRPAVDGVGHGAGHGAGHAAPEGRSRLVRDSGSAPDHQGLQPRGSLGDGAPGRRTPVTLPDPDIAGISAPGDGLTGGAAGAPRVGAGTPGGGATPRRPVPVRGRRRPRAAMGGPGRRQPGRRSARGAQVMTAEVVLALSAMCVLRGGAGFLTFLLAFGLRRASAATVWYGLVLATSTAGSLVGSLSVPRIRRALAQEHIILASLGAMVLVSAAAAFVGGWWVQSLLTFAAGLGLASAKPSFDSLLQHYVPHRDQGKAFASSETRLQLVWVVGSLLPVVWAFPVEVGDIVLSCVAAFGAVTYLTARRALTGVVPRAGGGMEEER